MSSRKPQPKPRPKPTIESLQSAKRTLALNRHDVDRLRSLAHAADFDDRRALEELLDAWEDRGDTDELREEVDNLKTRVEELEALQLDAYNRTITAEKDLDFAVKTLRPLQFEGVDQVLEELGNVSGEIREIRGLVKGDF